MDKIATRASKRVQDRVALREAEAAAGAAPPPPTAANPAAGAAPAPSTSTRRPRSRARLRRPKRRAKTNAEIQRECRARDAERIHDCPKCGKRLANKRTFKAHLQSGAHNMTAKELATEYWLEILRGRERTSDDDDEEEEDSSSDED